jgi:hypothetical protein
VSEIEGAPSGERLPLRVVLETLAHLATTVGIFLLIYQLNSDASYKRSDRSLTLVDEYTAGRVSEYRAALLKPWLERADELEIIRRAGGARQEEVDALVELTLEAHDAKHPEDRIDLAVHELGSFFDRVQLCISSSVCDRRIALDYFRGPAVQYHCLYGPVLAKQAVTLGTPELGTGLARLRGASKC